MPENTSNSTLSENGSVLDVLRAKCSRDENGVLDLKGSGVNLAELLKERGYKNIFEPDINQGIQIENSQHPTEIPEQ